MPVGIFQIRKGVIGMKYVLKNAFVFQNSKIEKKDLLISDGKIVSIGIGVSVSQDSAVEVIDMNCFSRFH